MEKRNENCGESRTWDINYRMNVKLTELTVFYSSHHQLHLQISEVQILKTGIE